MLKSDDTQNDKTIQLTENYRLKYDIYKNKWIEKIAEAERLVSEFAKAIGKELDNGKRTD